MNSSTTLSHDWEAFFCLVADHLRHYASQQWPLEADGSGSDVYVSLHRLFNAFPFPADILLFCTDGIESQFKEERYATAIRYDASKPNGCSVQFHGIVPLVDLASHAALVKSVLGVDDDTLESLRSLRLRFTTDLPHIVHLIPYDPRLTPLKYADDLAFHLDSVLELFTSRIDFNDKYGLGPDTVLDESGLFQICKTGAGFFPYERGEAIRSVQERVADVQLLKHVPEPVERAFYISKRLFIFGIFEYHFFTVSAHYAYLAVESAIYHRWNLALPKPTILQHGTDTLILPHTGRGAISLICRQRGWKAHKVLVNGRPYPSKVGAALADLRKDNIITDWQHKRLRDVWMHLRNSHSHLEFVSITGPTATLRRAAEVINTLFDSVKP